MWWEAIPAMVVITTCLSISQYATTGIHLLMFGTPYRRDLTTCFQRTMLFRDARVAGSPFNHIGLEGVPDEPSSK